MRSSSPKSIRNRLPHLPQGQGMGRCRGAQCRIGRYPLVGSSSQGRRRKPKPATRGIQVLTVNVTGKGSLLKALDKWGHRGQSYDVICVQEHKVLEEAWGLFREQLRQRVYLLCGGPALATEQGGISIFWSLCLGKGTP